MKMYCLCNNKNNLNTKHYIKYYPKFASHPPNAVSVH